MDGRRGKTVSPTWQQSTETGRPFLLIGCKRDVDFWVDHLSVLCAARLHQHAQSSDRMLSHPAVQTDGNMTVVMIALPLLLLGVLFFLGPVVMFGAYEVILVVVIVMNFS
jgi:hypothetical protein